MTTPSDENLRSNPETIARIAAERGWSPEVARGLAELRVTVPELNSWYWYDLSPERAAAQLAWRQRLTTGDLRGRNAKYADNEAFSNAQRLPVLHRYAMAANQDLAARESAARDKLRPDRQHRNMDVLLQLELGKGVGPSLGDFPIADLLGRFRPQASQRPVGGAGRAIRAERQTRADIYVENRGMHPSPVVSSSKRAELT